MAARIDVHQPFINRKVERSQIHNDQMTDTWRLRPLVWGPKKSGDKAMQRLAKHLLVVAVAGSFHFKVVSDGFFPRDFEG